MEISAEKTELMTNNTNNTNNTNGINADIRAKDKNLEADHSFKYLGPIIADEGSKPELLPRISQITAALTKRKTI